MREVDRNRLPANLRRLVDWQNDPASYERTQFELHDLSELLQALLMWDNLPDDQYDAVSAMFLALHNRHPHFRLKWSRTAPNKRNKIQRYLSNASSADVANFIDIEVANGVKQESAIEDAITKFSVSRRNAFRALEHERMVRKAALELGEVYNVPEGFEATADGQLKRRER